MLKKSPNLPNLSGTNPTYTYRDINTMEKRTKREPWIRILWLRGRRSRGRGRGRRRGWCVEVGVLDEIEGLGEGLGGIEEGRCPIGLRRRFENFLKGRYLYDEWALFFIIIVVVLVSIAIVAHFLLETWPLLMEIVNSMFYTLQRNPLSFLLIFNSNLSINFILFYFIYYFH